MSEGYIYIYIIQPPPCMPTGPTAESPKTNDFTQPLGPSRQPPIFSAQIRGTACMIISSCLVASPIMNPNTCYLQILAQRLQIPAKITKDCMGLSGKGNDQLGLFAGHPPSTSHATQSPSAPLSFLASPPEASPVGRISSSDGRLIG